MTNETHHCGVGLQCYTWASSITAGSRLMARNKICRWLMTFWIQMKLRKEKKNTKNVLISARLTRFDHCGTFLSVSYVKSSSMLKSTSKGNFICTAATFRWTSRALPCVCVSSLCVLWFPPRSKDLHVRWIGKPELVVLWVPVQHSPCDKLPLSCSCCVALHCTPDEVNAGVKWDAFPTPEKLCVAILCSPLNANAIWVW